MTRHDLLVQVAKDALTHLPAGDDWVLACMTVLHTHNLILDESCALDDMDPKAERKLHAITGRHAAEVVAAAVGKSGQLSTMDYWYTRYVSDASYEVMENVPERMLSKVKMAKIEMAKHPQVRDIIEEE